MGGLDFKTWGLINIPGPQMTMGNFSHVVGHIIVFGGFPQWSSYVKDLLINPHLFADLCRVAFSGLRAARFYFPDAHTGVGPRSQTEHVQ